MGAVWWGAMRLSNGKRPCFLHFTQLQVLTSCSKLCTSASSFVQAKLSWGWFVQGSFCWGLWKTSCQISIWLLHTKLVSLFCFIGPCKGCPVLSFCYAFHTASVYRNLFFLWRLGKVGPCHLGSWFDDSMIHLWTSHPLTVLVVVRTFMLEDSSTFCKSMGVPPPPYH